MARRKARKRLASPLRLFAGAPEVTPYIQAAFDEAVRKYMHRPAVTGIDVGYKYVDGVRTRKLAIRIHVREKFATRALRAMERFPRSINGVPVDVIEAAYGSHQVVNVHGQASPLQPGISISRTDNTSGTLGVFVSDADDPAKHGLLSAAHVLFAELGVPFDSIIQPGLTDGGTPAEEIARTARAELKWDAAFAVLTGARPFTQQVAISGMRLIAPRPPRMDEVLEKCGRSTKVTRALVDGMGHFMGVQDAIRLVGLDEQPIVDFGDSGAPWYDPLTGAAVGLHCKGPDTFTPSMNFAIASQLTVVVDKLRVTVL